MSGQTKCTVCAFVPSVGFYTGCMIADGHDGNGWLCDGKGNLTKKSHGCVCEPSGSDGLACPDASGTPLCVCK